MDEALERLLAVLDQQNMAAYSEMERQRLQKVYSAPQGVKGQQPTLEIVDEV